MSSNKAFEIEVKRFYLPGYELTDECPKCKATTTYDLEDNYLSYPTANKPTRFNFCCSNCDHEWHRQILLTVKVELLPAASAEETP